MYLSSSYTTLEGDFLPTIRQNMHLSGPAVGALNVSRLKFEFASLSAPNHLNLCPCSPYYPQPRVGRACSASDATPGRCWNTRSG